MIDTNPPIINQTPIVVERMADFKSLYSRICATEKENGNKVNKITMASVILITCWCWF